jgi:hypothetical protein
MRELMQDVWHDLVEKRLWPVAVALVVGIVAIPVVMMSPAEEPAVPVSATPTAVDPPADTVALRLAETSREGAGSSLDTLAEKNPFNPPAKVMSAGKGESTGSATAAGADSGAEAGGGEGGAQQGGGDTGTDAPSGSPPSSTPTEPERTTTEYVYVADVTFWKGDRRRQVKGLQKLDMLPSQASPVLIFMGTTKGGGNAVFLVDSTLKTAGEGRCSPSRSNCAFVNIGPGAEHTFTSDEGDSYRLRVDEIRKVPARRANASAAESKPVAGTAMGSPEEPSPFRLPSLIDVVVETTAGSNSSIEQASR